MAGDKTQKQKAETPVTVFRDRYDATIECPWCGSTDTRVVNPFGGAVSEIAFTCQSCGNPFGWMKW